MIFDVMLKEIYIFPQKSKGKGGAGEGFDLKTRNLGKANAEEDQVNTDPSITKD